MTSLTTRINSLDFPNPFIIGSGPLGTNKSTISKAFKEGWGGVVAKTISLDHTLVHNVTPRYAKLRALESQEVIGFQNIELISDRPLTEWLKDFRAIKTEFPEQILIASLMETYDRAAWTKLTQACDEAGVDGFELNFSCPHGHPERKMGAAMGQVPEIVTEVTSWVRAATTKPVWAKMTPNTGSITAQAQSAFTGGADGISLINTMLGIIGVNLETLRPLPTVEGYSTPGGYSGRAVKPIALRMVSEVARLALASYPSASVSGVGGIETADDAAEFFLLGASTVQLCTAPMIHGFGIVRELEAGLKKVMDRHGFKSLDEMRGASLKYLTSFERLSELKRGRNNGAVKKDEDWSGETFVAQASQLASDDGTR